MNKRLEKRHKRQVTRARARVSLSVPDTRTPDQLKADREASRRAPGPRTGPQAHHVNNAAHTPAAAEKVGA